MNATQGKALHKQVIALINDESVCDTELATELLADANQALADKQYDKLGTLAVELQRGEYAVTNEEDTSEADTTGLNASYLESIKEHKATGHDKQYSRGWLMMHGIAGQKATPYLEAVYGVARSGAVSKAEIVSYIIAHSNDKPATLAKGIANKFGFKLSTGRTIAAHLQYMIEYAKQVNNKE